MVRLLAIILFCSSFSVFSTEYSGSYSRQDYSNHSVIYIGEHTHSINYFALNCYRRDEISATEVTPVIIGVSANGTTQTLTESGTYYFSASCGDTYKLTYYHNIVDIPKTVIVRYTVNNTYSQSVAFHTVSGSPPASFSVAGGASGSGDCTFSWTGDAPAPFSLVLFGGGFVVATTFLDLSQYQDGDIIPVGVTYGNIGSSGEQEIPPGNPPPELPPANPPGIPENPPVIEEPGQPEIFQHIAGDEIESIKNGTNPTFGAFDAGTMDFGDVVSQLMTSASGFISCINNFNSKMGEILHKVRTLYIPSVNDRCYRFPFMVYKGETYYMDLTHCSWLFEKMRTMFRYGIYLLFMWQLFLIVRYLIGGK